MTKNHNLFISWLNDQKDKLAKETKDTKDCVPILDAKDDENASYIIVSKYEHDGTVTELFWVAKTKTTFNEEGDVFDTYPRRMFPPIHNILTSPFQ